MREFGYIVGQGSIPGSMTGHHAWSFNGGTSAAKALSTVFAKGLTRSFSIVFIVRFNGNDGRINAIRVKDQGDIYASVSVDVSYSICFHIWDHISLDWVEVSNYKIKVNESGITVQS